MISLDRDAMLTEVSENLDTNFHSQRAQVAQRAKVPISNEPHHLKDVAPILRASCLALGAVKTTETVKKSR